MPLLGFIIAGFISSAVVIWALTRFWSLRLGWDRGDLLRKSQRRPVLRLGGVALALSIGGLGLVVYSFSAEQDGSAIDLFWPAFLYCAGLLVVGLWDDLVGCAPLRKLSGQVVVASIAVLLGLRIEVLSIPFREHEIDLGMWAFPITVAWLVALPNLVNIIDGVDGLAGGIGAAALATLGVIAWHGGFLGISLHCAVAVGAVAAFLLFNFPRARIYLGDSGAYLIGGFLAAASLAASQKGAIASVLLVVVVALAVPIADAVLAVLRRAFYGVPVWRADAEHIHHRLITLGLRRELAVALLVGGALVLCVLALSYYLSQGASWPVLVTVCAVLAVLLLKHLGYLRAMRHPGRSLRRLLHWRSRIRFATALAAVLEHELDTAPSSDALWERFRDAMGKVGLVPGGSPSKKGDSAKPTITLTLADGGSWVLTCSADEEEALSRRLAVCFLGVLWRGIQLVGKLPDDFGVTLSGSRKDVLSCPAPPDTASGEHPSTGGLTVPDPPA